MPTKSKTPRKASLPTPAPSTPAPDTPAAEPSHPPGGQKPLGGKLGVMAGLLRRPEGATISQLAEATGWQAHSVRGAMAGALKKRGLVVTSEKADTGRVYRLPPGDEAPAVIGAELARRAAALLSTAAAELFEDEHLALVTRPGVDLGAHADRLLALGSDVAALGQALSVIVRRADPEDGA